MTTAIYLHFPADALSTDSHGQLVVDWFSVSGQQGREELGVLLDQSPDALFRVILSVADTFLTDIELTRRQARHLKQALPFLLEDKLLDRPDSLLFASAPQQNGHYPVAAVDRRKLEALAGFFHEQGGQLDDIAIDANLLAAARPCTWQCGDEYILLTDDAQALQLDAGALDTFCKQGTSDDVPYTELDDDTARQYMLASLQKPHISLMQPQWQFRRSQSGSLAGFREYWQGTVIAVAVIVCLILLGTGIQYFRYHKAANYWQHQSAELFEALFPKDRATSKLRAQFRGHLHRLQTGTTADGGFLSIMQLAEPVLVQQHNKGITTRRIEFDQRTGKLLVDVDAQNYQGLQALRHQLESVHLDAKITVAKSHGKQVRARIKVGLG